MKPIQNVGMTLFSLFALASGVFAWPSHCPMGYHHSPGKPWTVDDSATWEILSYYGNPANSKLTEVDPATPLVTEVGYSDESGLNRLCCSYTLSDGTKLVVTSKESLERLCLKEKPPGFSYNINVYHYSFLGIHASGSIPVFSCNSTAGSPEKCSWTLLDKYPSSGRGCPSI